MSINILYAFFWIIFFAGLVTAGRGYSLQCCDMALQTLAYLNKSVPQEDYKCGQVYEPALPPAPPLLVPTSWCRQKCSGYALSAPSDTNAWAAPLIQYILPAVIFSMTIPRRLVLEPPKWFFDFSVNHMTGLIKALFSLCVAGMIVTLDTAVWVFMIMVAPAPFIFSGLREIVLDYRIIRNLLSSKTGQGEDKPVGLDRGPRVELLTAVLAGNLGIEGVPADPQKDLGRVLDINHPEEVALRLEAMLACQYPFGAAVGAPILLYIGSFVYTLATIRSSDGARGTARALAFGIWWMNIVHVSAVSGCLLASNNPNTAAAIVKLRRKKVGLQGRLDYADQRSQMEDRIQARLEAWSRLPLSYKAGYEPVWMWTRGKSKAGWLQETSAWKENDWFREKVEMTVPGWIFLAFVAFLLVLFPCALAFWIEYSTPAKGVGCRSLTILVYASSQFTFTALSAWSHFKASHNEEYWEAHPWLRRLRRKSVGVSVAVIFLIPAWVAAVFTTFAGTLMQITGIFQNCLCASSGYWSWGSTSTVQLAADTEADRNASLYWQKAGYTALIFLAVVTYLAWWCQCYLREKFIERVQHLVLEAPMGNQTNETVNVDRPS